MSDQTIMETLIHRHRHLTTAELATIILDDLGIRKQFDIRNVYERDGMSLTTSKARPHGRWVSDWHELD